MRIDRVKFVSELTRQDLGFAWQYVKVLRFLDLIAQNMRVYISIWKVRNGARKIDLIKL